MNNLQFYREKAGLTQQELADKLEIDRKTLSRAENGVKDLLGSVYRKVAEILGVTTDDLLGVRKE